MIPIKDNIVQSFLGTASGGYSPTIRQLTTAAVRDTVTEGISDSISRALNNIRQPLRDVIEVNLGRIAEALRRLKPLFSGASDNWATPQALFNELDSEFGFELDVCASASNAKCQKFFTKEDDGLSQNWSGVCWMNPPYGRKIIHWMQKAHESAKAGATVVCLVPSRTDTKWWHAHARFGEVRFIKGRLKFGDGKGTAPFPSAVVIFRPLALNGVTR